VTHATSGVNPFACSASFLKNKLPVYLAGSVEPAYKKSLEDFGMVDIEEAKKLNLEGWSRVAADSL